MHESPDNGGMISPSVPLVALRRRSHSAFTLVELLVVIAVFAVLAAILMPVFSTARERARQTACLSNMRQLAMAVQMYVQDADEVLPMCTNYAAPANAPDRLWTGSLRPYTRSEGLFLCPSATGARYAADWEGRGRQPIGYNSRTGHDPRGLESPVGAMALASLDEPSRSVLLAETASGDTAQKYRGYTFDPDVPGGRKNRLDPRLNTPLAADRDLVAGSTLSPAFLKPLYCRHLRDGRNHGLCTLVMADGRARAYTAAAILAQEGGAALFWRPR